MPGPESRKKSMFATMIIFAGISLISFYMMFFATPTDVSVRPGSRWNLFIYASGPAPIYANIAFFSFVVAVVMLLLLRSSPRLDREGKSTHDPAQKSKADNHQS
jgi:hypothetical protein